MLIDTVPPIFNVMNGNRCNSSTFYSRQKVFSKIGWDFMSFCETKVFFQPSERWNYFYFVDILKILFKCEIQDYVSYEANYYAHIKKNWVATLNRTHLFPCAVMKPRTPVEDLSLSYHCCYFLVKCREWRIGKLLRACRNINYLVYTCWYNMINISNSGLDTATAVKARG